MYYLPMKTKSNRFSQAFKIFYFCGVECFATSNKTAKYEYLCTLHAVQNSSVQFVIKNAARKKGGLLSHCVLLILIHTQKKPYSHVVVPAR
jgi:hypothetical protein